MFHCRSEEEAKRQNQSFLHPSAEVAKKWFIPDLQIKRSQEHTNTTAKGSTAPVQGLKTFHSLALSELEKHMKPKAYWLLCRTSPDLFPIISTILQF